MLPLQNVSSFLQGLGLTTALEFKRSYSQQKFVEESEIAWNSMKSFQSILRVLCYIICTYGIISLCRFYD